MSSNYILELIDENDYLPVYFRQVQCDALTVPPHWHDHLELVYLISGSMIAVVQSKSYKLTPGTLLVVNSKEIHMTRTYGESYYLLLQIPTDQIKNRFVDFDRLRFQTMINEDGMAKSRNEIDNHFSRMLDLFSHKEDGYPLLFTSCVYTLLYFLYQNYSIRLKPDQKSEGQRDFRRVTKTMNWVNQNFKESLTLDAAAANLGISKEYFCRLFKKCTGQTFIEYLYAVRATNFYEDLKRTENSITLLLAENGITNYKLFMRTFKKLYGDTPRNIKKYI
ncbi:MAG: helix-turn-helix domain-containing protein [Lachnospiraceae bacterium]